MLPFLNSGPQMSGNGNNELTQGLQLTIELIKLVLGTKINEDSFVRKFNKLLQFQNNSGQLLNIVQTTFLTCFVTTFE